MPFETEKSDFDLGSPIYGFGIQVSDKFGMSIGVMRSAFLLGASWFDGVVVVHFGPFVLMAFYG